MVMAGGEEDKRRNEAGRFKIDMSATTVRYNIPVK
jgi:hypothetical protein